MFIIYSISLSSHTKFLFYVYFMLTVAPGGNNLATICYKDFLGLATINMYYYYYYYYHRFCFVSSESASYLFMPSTFNTPNNPNCSICDKYVRSGILCDICNRWSHTKCNNLTPTDFNSLKNSEETWFCTSCIMTIFPFNSKANYNITDNKNISNIKNFFTELNSINESNDNGVEQENVAGMNCKYYDSEEFIEKFSNSKCFSAFHLNISSLTKHFDELQTLLSLLDVNFSVIVITETKFLKNTQPSINFSLQNYI